MPRRNVLVITPESLSLLGVLVDIENACSPVNSENRYGDKIT